MFNFGDDDKEKLKENMEDIKEMVDSGESIGPGEQQEGPGRFKRDGETADMEAPQGGQQNTTGFGQQDSSFDDQEAESQDDSPDNQAANFDSPTPDQNLDQEQQLEQELESFEERFGGNNQQTKQASTQQQPQQNNQQSSQSTQEQPQQMPQGQPQQDQKRSRSEKSGLQDSRDVNSLSQEVPKPPETRDIDVPEIDRGPLFLRQQKFRRAKQLIEEMLYISSEVENTVNNLEAGIQEDQATERDIREMLKELEGGRSDVEDIISPREE